MTEIIIAGGLLLFLLGLGVGMAWQQRRERQGRSAQRADQRAKKRNVE